MSSTEQQIEQEIQDKGLNAPRLTPRHIDAVIVEEHYFTAEDGATNAPPDMCNRGEFPHLAQITFCVLILKNGYKITGVNHSSVSPENHDPEMGRKLAYEDARNKIWELEGYLLKEKLYLQNSQIGSNADINKYEHYGYIKRTTSDPTPDLPELKVATGEPPVNKSCCSGSVASGYQLNEKRDNAFLVEQLLSNNKISPELRKKAESKMLKLLDELI